MEWNDDIDLAKRGFTSRLIVQRVLARGWKICGFTSNKGLFLIYIPERAQPIQIFSSAPSKTSYPAAKIAQDKFITNQILAHEKLPVPAELLVDAKSSSDHQTLRSFIERYQTVVIKPLDSAHGKGITINLNHFDQLMPAIDDAILHSRGGKVLIQQQIQGFDIRIICIDYEFCEAISRRPAQVLGDGLHNIQELVAITNKHPERGENYKAKLNFIPLDKVQKYLGDEEIQRVPADGEEVRVIGVSNVGTGGERKNITTTIPEYLKDIARSACLLLQTPVCGLDFMVRSLPTVNSQAEDLDAHIIELNTCPSLLVHDDLGSPEQLAIIDRYVDFLAK